MYADMIMMGYAMWFDTDASKPRMKVVYLDNPDYTAVMALKWQYFEEESYNMPRENLFELKFIVERNADLIIEEWNEKKST